MGRQPDSCWARHDKKSRGRRAGRARPGAGLLEPGDVRYGAHPATWLTRVLGEYAVNLILLRLHLLLFLACVG